MFLGLASNIQGNILLCMYKSAAGDREGPEQGVEKDRATPPDVLVKNQIPNALAFVSVCPNHSIIPS